jgi:LruC domain-containing protein
MMHFRSILNAAGVLLAWAAAGIAAPGFDYLAPYDTNGVPSNALPQKEIFSQSFLQDVANSLPEYKSLVSSHPEYITGDAGANIHLNSAAEVFVTFLHEGAGYRNALGYFTYATAAMPKSEAEIAGHILFSNASFPNSGGNLASGTTVNLGVFPADTHIGFFVIANGWTGSRVQAGNWTVYSLADLNPEPDASLRRHVALLWDPGTQRAVLSFEDVRRDWGSDNDFNDVIFTVRTTPVVALDTSALKPIDPVVDADGDGATDGIDQYPADPLRAFEILYPSAGAWGTIAFEDNWPAKGDFDFNDLVVKYQSKQVTNAVGLVQDVILDFEVVARGAAFHDGFAVRFPGVLRSNAASLTLATNNGAAVPLAPENGQADVVALVFADAHLAIGTPDKFANTYAGNPRTTGPRYVLTLKLTTPVSPADLGPPPYDSFMIIDGQRGREVHQVQFPPTALADPRLLGTQADTYNPRQGRYYRTAENLPWVLVFPFEFPWPTEKSDIGQAYPRLLDWGYSGGKAYINWYQVDTRAEYLWR